jgi:hypothetical protein
MVEIRKAVSGSDLKWGVYFNTADDQVLLAEIENELQCSLYHLSMNVRVYNLIYRFLLINLKW